MAPRRTPKRRSIMRNGGIDMARDFPDEMRARMAPMLDTYLDEFSFDMVNRTLDGSPKCEMCGRGPSDPQPNPAHRTAMDMYPRIMRAVGASDDLIEALLRRLSMPSEASLLQAAELYQAVQGKDVHEIYRECRRMCEWYEGPSGPGAGKRA